MAGSIDIPFAIGSTVWWTGHKYREERTTCEECLGSRVVTMTLGNGEKYALECEACRSGYEPSRGWVTRQFVEYRPVPFLCARVIIDGSRVSYSEQPPEASSYSYSEIDNLFADKEKCVQRCEQLNAEHAKRAEEQAIACLESRRRSLAWSVHYWRSQKKKLERDLQRISERLAACKHPPTKPEDVSTP